MTRAEKTETKKGALSRAGGLPTQFSCPAWGAPKKTEGEAMAVQDFADAVNDYCAKSKYFWACGLVKETIGLWRDNLNLLCEQGQTMARHYLAETRKGA